MVEDLLGEGTYGQVAGCHVSTNPLQKYAVKVKNFQYYF